MIYTHYATELYGGKYNGKGEMKHKKTAMSLLVAGLVALNLTTANAAKKPDTGNGNEGCQIGNILGHKNGQSNEHKIDYMTKTDWEAYCIAHGLDAQQMSNNEGSNGWITYHIYKDGKQVEVVHIRFIKEEPEQPVEPEEPDVPVNPEESEQLSDPEEPTDPEEPEIPVNPEEPDVEEPDPEEPTDPTIPWTPIESAEPIKPVDPIESAEPAQPIEPAGPVQPDPGPMGDMGQEDEELVEPIHPDSPNQEESEVEKTEEPADDEEKVKAEIDNPQTGDDGILIAGGLLVVAVAVLALRFKIRK